MRDIPLFTTSAGVASLFLKNVSFSETAYIRIMDSLEPEILLHQCVNFCKAVGARSIYASGIKALPGEAASCMITMQADLNSIPHTDAHLVPVTGETMEQWRTIYNEKMKTVPTAELISYQNSRKYLEERNCYFVYRNQELLGIGVTKENNVDAIASIQPGAGQDVLSALCHGTCIDTVSLQVADTNIPAMKLYKRLGFTEQEVLEQWHKIL